jgi:hypothetical protein
MRASAEREKGRISRFFKESILSRVSHLRRKPTTDPRRKLSSYLQRRLLAFLGRSITSVKTPHVSIESHNKSSRLELHQSI